MASDSPPLRPDLCEYGAVCTRAHSEQELQEWKRRAQMVEEREQAAFQEGLMPYRERLLAEYQSSREEILVVSGASPGGRGGWGLGLAF